MVVVAEVSVSSEQASSGMWYMVCGTWYMVRGTWYVVCVVCGLQRIAARYVVLVCARRMYVCMYVCV